jgi:hypothetical protein
VRLEAYSEVRSVTRGWATGGAETMTGSDFLGSRLARVGQYLQVRDDLRQLLIWQT